MGRGNWRNSSGRWSYCIAAGIKLGSIHPGSLVGTEVGGFNLVSLATSASGSIAGGIAGSVLGACGIVPFGGIAIPAWPMVAGGSSIFGPAGYTVGDAVFKFLNLPVNIGQVFAGGSLLAVGVALIIDGARRLITDGKFKSLLCDFRDGVIYLVSATAEIVKDSWEVLKRLVIPNSTPEGIGAAVSSVAVGGTGAVIGGSVAAGTVTVLGSHAIGGIVLSLGLVSAPLWPVIACGAGGAALGYGVWRFFWGGSESIR